MAVAVCSSCGLSPHKDGACPDELEAVREVSEAAVKALATERAEIARLQGEVAKERKRAGDFKARTEHAWRQCCHHCWHSDAGELCSHHAHHLAESA